ncbi:hypothetical protein CVT25_014041 [Psilocybe cyanescens]|uniref:Uncharacterized protein n=1 Tax=Psilocybe cyanescens TaxID=93625 RepID=A0A409XJW0_PSICY|nr:hypothetical protein CVT25_014041 [Psilocybe cyanescens]
MYSSRGAAHTRTRTPLWRAEPTLQSHTTTTDTNENGNILFASVSMNVGSGRDRDRDRGGSRLDKAAQ